MMRLRILLVTIFIFQFVCSCNNEMANKARPTLNFLGDSIIEIWKELGDAFPDYECKNLGWSGKGIDTFLGRINISSLAGTDCVVEIGTNDMGMVIRNNSLDEYALHYIDVLKSLKARRIYLFSLIPRNREKDGEFPYNANYIIFNQKIQALTQSEMDNVIYVPVFEAFLKDGKINPNYTFDGLHPSAEGYQVMARELRKYLMKSTHPKH